MRKITIRPNRREQIDVHHLARALLRLAQQQYDAALPNKDQRSPSLDAPVSGADVPTSGLPQHDPDLEPELDPPAAHTGDEGP